MNHWLYPDDRYYYGWYDDMVPGRRVHTDSELKALVVGRLRTNVFTKDHDLRVDTKAGVVILRGEVETRLAKRAAGDDCWDTPGVIDVSNQLKVNECEDIEHDEENRNVGGAAQQVALRAMNAREERSQQVLVGGMDHQHTRTVAWGKTPVVQVVSVERHQRAT